MLYIFREKYSLIVWLYALTALISMLANFSFYYFSGCVGIAILITLFFTMYLAVNQKCFLSYHNKNSAIAYLFIWSFVFTCSFYKTGVIIDGIFWLFIFYGVFLLLLNRKTKQRVFDLFVRLFSILLLCSLVEFVIYYFTGISVISRHVSRNNGQEFQHLFFNLVKEGGFQRFQSLADEPGLIGTVCGFLTFVLSRAPERYKFERIVFIISGVFTFSIAFFFLAGISFFSHRVNVKTVFFISLVLGVVYFVFNDLVYSRIILRFAEGSFDNRTTDSMRLAFSEAWDNGDLWLGVGFGAHEKLGEGLAEDGGAGAIIFLYEYGIIGTLLIVVLYSMIVIRNATVGMWDKMVYLFAFWASFYQRQTIDRPYTILAFFAFAFLSFIKKDEKRKEVRWRWKKRKRSCSPATNAAI